MPRKLELPQKPDIILDVMKQVKMFDGLQEKESIELFSICDLLEFEADEQIFSEGSISTGLYVIFSGRVKITVGARTEIHEASAGDVLGEIGLLCQVQRTATATCHTDAVLLHIRKQDLNHLLGKLPHCYAVIISNIATQLAQRVIDITDTKTILDERFSDTSKSF